MTTGLQQSISKAKEVFPSGTPEAAVCAYVFDQFNRLGKHFRNITPHAVANALKLLDEDTNRRAVMSALDYLAFGPIPILERRFELWRHGDSDEVLEEPICELSVSDMRNALEGKFPIDPTTGEAIPDFLNRVTVIYIVTKSAREDAEKGFEA